MTDEEQIAEEKLCEDMKAIFLRLEPGKRLYKWFNQFCCGNRQTYIDGDSRGSDFNCGAREVFLAIQKRIESDEEQKPVISGESK
jgi:hypothetical protein